MSMSKFLKFSFAFLLVLGSCLLSFVLKAMEVEVDINPSKKRQGSELDIQDSLKRVKHNEAGDYEFWLPCSVNQFEISDDFCLGEYDQEQYEYNSYFQKMLPQAPGESFANNSNSVITNSARNTFSNTLLDKQSNNNSIQTCSNTTNNSSEPNNKKTTKASKKKKMYDSTRFSAKDLDIQINNKSLQLKDAKIEFTETRKLPTSTKCQDWFILTFKKDLEQITFELSDADLMKYVINNDDKRLIIDGTEALNFLKMTPHKRDFKLKLFKLIFESASMTLPEEVHKQLKDLLNTEILTKPRKNIVKEFLGYKNENEAKRNKWIHFLSTASDWAALEKELNNKTLELRDAEIGVIPKTAHTEEFPHRVVDVGFYLSFNSLMDKRVFRVLESKLVYFVPYDVDKKFIVAAGIKASELETSNSYSVRTKLKLRLFEIVFKDGMLSQKVRNQLQLLLNFSGSKAQALALVGDIIENPEGSQSTVTTNLPYPNGYFLGQNISSNQISSVQNPNPYEIATYPQQQALYQTATGLTQGFNQNVHMHSNAPQQRTDFNWYLMNDLDSLAGKSVENTLKNNFVPVKQIICLNDRQLAALGYQSFPLHINNEKWYIVETLYPPPDINFWQEFVKVSVAAYLNTPQLEWLQSLGQSMQTQLYCLSEQKL